MIAHSTWHQNASLSSPCDRDAMTSRSVPALMKNMCRCSQDGVTTFVSSGWGAGNKEAEIHMTPGGWG